MTELKMDWGEFSEEAMSHLTVRLELEHDAMMTMMSPEARGTVSREDIRAHMDEVFEGVMNELLENLKEDILHERSNIIDNAIDNIPHEKEA